MDTIQAATKIKDNFPKIVIPHAVVIGFFYLVSGGLTELANNIGKLHLSVGSQMIIMWGINSILSSVNQALKE